ncbi:hypothetical protein DW019_11240 [Clostridium sp. AF37-5]|jgi:hypothetical protein|uniref:DUF7666 domain-containing protein n=1 Tax=Clostridium sp. AF37-5 TaxID=2293016 RepID=UPI000E4F9D8D|nr:hypothetical protein [Clostridium sp. AF37-5]RHO95819.1 hypothetical protein DW019_11240 [Clostridium sp. AF37-5]
MNNKGYKAFNPDFTCNGKQYEENTIYEENGSEICKAGVMHYCENPFDVLNYYPLVNESGEISEFAEVEPLGKIFREENKSATNKLHIKAKLGLKEFIKACINFTLEKTIEENENNAENDNGNNFAQIGSNGKFAQIGSSGNYAKIGSSGSHAKIGSNGDSAQIGSSGSFAQIGSSGNSAQIGSNGHFAKIGSSGDSARIGSSGNFTKIGSSGNSAQIGSRGDSARIGSSGDFAKITSEGYHSVVMAAGYSSIARAKKGSWITLAEWNEKDGHTWTPKCVKTEYVDGERIKEDTFYKLVDGEFTEY